MKVLTLTQPWATLVAIGAKKIETRSWSTPYRGPLAIHAAKGFPKWAKEGCAEPLFHEALYAAGYDIGLRSSDILPRGMVIATCRLLDCLPMEAAGCVSGVFDDYPELNTAQERAFGDYAVGRWAWVLEDVKVLPEPIPAKGALGLWEYSGELVVPA